MSLKWNLNGKHYVLTQLKDSQKRSAFKNLLYIPHCCVLYMYVMISLLSVSLYCTVSLYRMLYVFERLSCHMSWTQVSQVFMILFLHIGTNFFRKEKNVVIEFVT